MPSEKGSSRNIFIRLNKSHDLDLICLKYAGYDIAELLVTVLVAFANGKPCTINAYKDTDMDISSISDCRIKCTIKDTDHATAFLLNNLKPRQKSAFCKALLRNSLSFSIMRPYLAIDDYDRILSLYASRFNFPHFTFDIEDFSLNRENKPKASPAVKQTVNVMTSTIRKEKPKSISPPAPEKTDFADDIFIPIDYNNSVENNDVTDLIDEFPGLFG